jgi:hypothetical protein
LFARAFAAEPVVITDELSEPNPDPVAVDAPDWLSVVQAPVEHTVGPEFGTVGPDWLRSTLNAPTTGWSADLDMLILIRTHADDLVLSRDLLTGDTLVNADDMSYSGEIGPRFQLRGPLADRWELEFGIFGVDGWRAQALVPGPQDLRIPGPDDGADFLLSTSPLLDMRSKLCSQELNLRRHLNQRVSVLAGFRALQLEEWYSVSTFSTRVYEVSADNRLYGFQIGADAKLARIRRLELSCFARVGLYSNDAVAETADPSGLFAATPQNRLLCADLQKAAFSAEAGLMGSIRLWGFLSLRGGYQVLHVESVALATDQLPYNDFSTLLNPLEAQSGIDAEGNVFYHGAVAGLEVRW